MIENQSFQSLQQLAVAVNVGFVALSSIYGNSAAREKSRIDELSTSVTMYRTHCVHENSDIEQVTNLYRDVMALRNDVRVEISRNEYILYRVCRPLGILSALIAFFLLVYSSYYPGEQAAWWTSGTSLLVNLPLIGFAVYNYVRSISGVAPISRRREIIDSALAGKLIVSTSSIGPV